MPNRNKPLLGIVVVSVLPHEFRDDICRDDLILF